MSRVNSTGESFVPVADIEVDAVRPERSGFVLQGRGADHAEYRVEMRLDIPVDRHTQTVLGEMLAQSELRVLRLAPASMRRSKARLRRNTVGS